MDTYEQKLLDDAISLCRSAKSIASRSGQTTNWDAFEIALDEMLVEHRQVSIPKSIRIAFESWIEQNAYFAHCEGGTLVRDGFGYEDATVHGAWLSRTTFLNAAPTPPAPAMFVERYSSDDDVPF